MKSVCIIGAGPGGLVAAKTFLQSGRFKVTVYEKNDKIGGIWAKRQGGDGYLSSQTPTNLSRFTVGFSDLSWQSLGEGHVPMFPSAARVGRYLELYRSRYLPDDVFKFQHSVTSADRVKGDDGYRWRVEVENKNPASAEANTSRSIAYFDYLINAAGFFSKPSAKSWLTPPTQSVKVLHTSEFRELDGLFNDTSPHHGKNILIYGGGNSAGETACNIAFQLSSSQFSADPSTDNDRFKDMKVYHVTPRPLYAIPPYVPGDVPNTFMPVDLKIYDLKWRPPGPIISSSGPLSSEVAAARYAAIHAAVGDQKDLGAEALVTASETTPYATLSESYAEFVRSGHIVPVAGRVVSYREQEADTVTAEIKANNGVETYIPDIAACVVGTGYTPQAALSFLSEEIKQTLEYDATSSRLPILLQNYQTLNPAVPDLGFIGFYEGPYWGVMEMQARLLLSLWSGTPLPSPADEALPTLRALRRAIKDGRSDIPQYWFSDYIGYLEEIALLLRLNRNDAPIEARTGPLSPARYLASSDNYAEAHSTMHDLADTLSAIAGGKYVARATFRALQGPWTMTRAITSARSDLPSGTLEGTASFHPRAPTAPGVDLEYLYIERGVFVAAGAGGGAAMEARRRYVYRYREEGDVLSVWFVNPDDDVSADGLFHDLAFSSSTTTTTDAGAGGGVNTDEQPPLRAHATHACHPDFYTTDYAFSFRAVAVTAFEVRHAVAGPGKEYVSVTRYCRPAAGGS